MSLSTQIKALVDRLAVEFKTAYGRMGNIVDLETDDKTNLVGAINEINARSTDAAVIDDTAPSLTKVYSSTKVMSEVNSAIDALLDGAPGALDTLKEIADALAGDQEALAAMMTAVNNRVRFDAAQVLTAPQQLQARTNIGAASAVDVGDTTTDFVAAFNTALAAA